MNPIDEIAAWFRLRDDEKRAVLAELPRRRDAHRSGGD
jgi:predicted Fe-S protein YdhL (DUF1289 family)